MPTVLVTSGKREENSPQHRPAPAMGESAVKHRKLYVDCLLDESKIYLIHGHGHSYD